MASIEAQPAPAYFVLTAFYLLTGKPDPETERPHLAALLGKGC